MAALTPLLPTRGLAQTPTFDLRWGGNVFDVFTTDGIEAWTVEDGGRIRHRNASGAWSFQTVPSVVKDTIHRIFFHPGTSGAQTGWAVGSDGSVLKTVDSGSNWNRVAQFDAVLSGKGPHEVLYAVHFVSADDGWIAGLHGIWYTEDGGTTWSPATLRNSGGSVINPTELAEIELYELDAVWDPDPPVLPPVGIPIVGLAAAEPGLVFSSKNGRDWEIVWDIREHCAELTQPCEQDVCAATDPDIWEPWDIEISRNSSQKLALLCGGIGFQCGMIWRSTNDGATWVKEEHECAPCHGAPCGNCTKYNVPPYAESMDDGDPNVYRLMKMRTVYNLDIFDDNNSAVAVGYNGQSLWRNPISQIWEDRSTFTTQYLTVPQATVVALFGVSSNSALGPGGKAISTGVGGTIRRSTDGGQTWIDDLPIGGEPYRSHDVDFLTSAVGWMVGQYTRIAKTTNNAATWTEALPYPDTDFVPLHAVAFADNDRGVAVGGVEDSPGYTGGRKMLYTLNGGSTQWNDASGTLVLAPSGSFGSLKDVTYVPGSTVVWAAGDKGFIARSSVNGTAWRQVLINGTQILNYEINGLAFKDSLTGLFVGRVGDTVTGYAARAYQLKIDASSGGHTWTMPAVIPISTSAPVSDLGDVVILGSDAYAVGETLETIMGEQVWKGIVLKSTFDGTNFGNFSPFSAVNQFPKCEVGGNLRGGEGTTGSTMPVLNRAAIPPTGSHLWVSGECGRVWRYTFPSGPWADYKSQTDTNILGISFPTSTVGFFVGYRYVETSQALVRCQ